jgi:hypothetical protein
MARIIVDSNRVEGSLKHERTFLPFQMNNLKRYAIMGCIRDESKHFPRKCWVYGKRKRDDGLFR